MEEISYLPFLAIVAYGAYAFMSSKIKFFQRRKRRDTMLFIDDVVKVVKQAIGYQNKNKLINLGKAVSK
jgi:hypothetical protein